jgi:hypothetical protein
MCTLSITERFHPCVLRTCRTWLVLASCPAFQGKQRSLRRMRQVLSWALAARRGRGAWRGSGWRPSGTGLCRPLYGSSNLRGLVTLAMSDW